MRLALTTQCIETFGKPSRVGLFRFGQGFKPFCQFRQSFIAGRLGESRVHFSVLVGFPLDRRLQVFRSRADRYAGARVSYLFEKIEVPEGMAGFRLGSISEKTS